MIRTNSSKQLTIAEFDWPFETTLDPHNRWVKLSVCIPWDELAELLSRVRRRSWAHERRTVGDRRRDHQVQAVFEGFHRAIIAAHESLLRTLAGNHRSSMVDDSFKPAQIVHQDWSRNWLHRLIY